MTNLFSHAARFCIVITACLGIAGCGKTAEALRRLAANGEIDRTAPVQAEAERIVAATPETVWRIVANVPGWPSWWPGVTTATIAGPFVPGTRFAWSQGVAIKSRLALVQPPSRLAWTGQAWTVRAIHVWRFDPIAGGTRVRVAESMAGFPVGWLFSSAGLRRNLQASLEGLHRAAEAPHG